MNCHGNNSDKKSGKKQNPLKHILMMALCCGLPILLIAIVPLLGSGNTALKSALVGISPFICPIMMFLMIPMMLRHSKQGQSCCRNEKADEVEKVDFNKLES